MTDLLFMGQQPETFCRERIYDGTRRRGEVVAYVYRYFGEVEVEIELECGETARGCWAECDGRDFPLLESERANIIKALDATWANSPEPKDYRDFDADDAGESGERSYVPRFR